MSAASSNLLAPLCKHTNKERERKREGGRERVYYSDRVYNTYPNIFPMKLEADATFFSASANSASAFCICADAAGEDWVSVSSLGVLLSLASVGGSAVAILCLKFLYLLQTRPRGHPLMNFNP